MNRGKEYYINIKLENFRFFHRASNPSEVDSKYIHRDKPEHKLKNWLLNKNRHGTYLVTGYRGVGKSSLVGSVIHQLMEEQKNQYVDVCVNIGQENINEQDILQIIAKNLRNELIRTTWFNSRGYDLLQAAKTHGYHLVILTVFSLLLLYFQQSIQYAEYAEYAEYATEPALKTCFEIIVWIFIALAGLCNIIYFIQVCLRKFASVYRAIDKLEDLCERFNTKTTYKISADSGFDQMRFGAIAKEREIQTANIQEIEYELTQVLKDYRQRKVIIVLDELDKADPATNKESREAGAPDYEKVTIRPEQHATSRSRRKQVLNVIANMKFFLATADAYFIFIAGRELYEASMADLSDRDFSISNIFNGILNVDSFFLHPENSDSIAYTEDFVCRQVLPSSYTPQKPGEYLTLRDYRNYRMSNSPGDHYVNKETTFLYHFVSYLAFISNGSPKKITSFFEKYIRTYEYLQQNDRSVPSQKKEAGSYWLSFGYDSQLKINFVHYITYPVMQNIMSRSSIFGDKLLVSDSFLLAHIFKLHNCGFSWRNLEQTPEVLEINRSPEIRDYIGSIISYMSHTHLTTISCGLYQYKFPMRLAEEISYFSKRSDEFSALFNFSLDEMQSIKEHYFHILDYNKLNESNKGEKSDADIYAEASIRHSLGDIYLQEENYSSAIRQFEKCIEIAFPLLEKRAAPYSQLQNYLIFYNRTMLKLGLAHEKRHTDNSAYGVYNDLINNLQVIRSQNPKVANLFRDNRTMHLGILAGLYVIEKLDTTGIQRRHIEEAEKAFDNLFHYRPTGSGTSKSPEENNLIVESDFYRKLGDIVYYKNVYEKKADNRSEQPLAKKYYRKAICILLNIEPEDLSNKFLWLTFLILRNPNTIVPSKGKPDIWLYNMALATESFGHIYLQDSKNTLAVKKDTPESEQNMAELKMIKKILLDSKIDREFKWPRSPLHKAIFCYWAASLLYGASCERGLASRCYKQLLNVLNQYVKTATKAEFHNNELIGNLEEIAQFVTRRYIMSQYRQYEHINFAEIEQLDRMLSSDDPLNLVNYLSVYPGVEEIECLYYTFVVSCCEYSKKFKLASQSALEEKIGRFIRKVLREENISNNTLTAVIHRHRLIAGICHYYVEELLDLKQGLLPADILPENVAKYLNSDEKIQPHIEESMPDLMRNLYNETDDAGTQRFKLLAAILSEAIKQLSYILKMIGPLHTTTLFNHTFRGNVYLEFAFFQELFNQLCTYYGCAGDEEKIHFEIDFETDGAGRFKDWDERRKTLIEIKQYDYMKACRRYSNIHYLIENAIHSYTKARQCSMQGQSYQELIRTLYFLEDDLNNDTIQFYLAMERAWAKYTKEIEDRLKKAPRYNKSPYYLLDTYMRVEEQNERIDMECE